MRKKDGYLVALIGLAMNDRKPLEQDVTLMVNGLLVTGFIVAYEKWRKHNVAVDAIGELLAKHAPADEAEAGEPPPHYIHLRDAKFYSPGQRPIPTGNEGAYVRIPLDAVDGFLMGYIGEVPTQQ